MAHLHKTSRSTRLLSRDLALLSPRITECHQVVSPLPVLRLVKVCLQVACLQVVCLQVECRQVVVLQAECLQVECHQVASPTLINITTLLESNEYFEGS